MKHTILGAGGAIGQPLAKELHAQGKDVRLVSRNPQRVNESDELFPADLTDPQAVRKAVNGSEVAYITVGFPYSTKVWQQVWPTFMRNTIDACADEGCGLVFFDNVYMYRRDQVKHMTEESKVDAETKKGKVREEIFRMLKAAWESGKIKGLVARSADFYGPDIANSVMGGTVIDRLKAGKKAQWLGRKDKLHNFTYTIDAGKATAMLALEEDTWNQVWHLPTDPNGLTGEDWVRTFSEAMNIEYKGVQVAPKWMVGLMGIFMPIMKELREMIYQYDRDYVFDSTKFDQRFGTIWTPKEEAIKAIVQHG